ncbi:Uncharacterised protein [Chlamydia trachomatis]|nr:Uncharacterised protein [Chlamydia trachomatis]
MSFKALPASFKLVAALLKSDIEDFKELTLSFVPSALSPILDISFATPDKLIPNNDSKAFNKAPKTGSCSEIASVIKTKES